MSIFKRAANGQAYLKAGFMGFAGDGKTFTATELAIGLVELMRKRKLAQGDKPVYFLDTETGSDWVKPRFDAANIILEVGRTRAFVDLIPAIEEVEQNGSILIIDSITHFWRKFTEDFLEEKAKKYKAKGWNKLPSLEFQDWNFLKSEWGKFTDKFVNSKCHIIMCGRAGYEYDFFENDNGKKELEKTGIKMKAEGETGYEPSLLVLMEKHSELLDSKNKQVWRTATIVKDRSTKIDGAMFTNPTFKDFLPHIEFLNLGGNHVSIDTSRDNSSLFADDGEPRWQKEKRAKEIALDEIIELLNKHHGGTSNDAKKAKSDLLEDVFGSRSWERIKTFDCSTVLHARNELWQKLEGVPYTFIRSKELTDDDVKAFEA